MIASRASMIVYTIVSVSSTPVNIRR